MLGISLIQYVGQSCSFHMECVGYRIFFFFFFFFFFFLIKRAVTIVTFF